MPVQQYVVLSDIFIAGANPNDYPNVHSNQGWFREGQIVEEPTAKEKKILALVGKPFNPTPVIDEETKHSKTGGGEKKNE